MFLIRLWHYLRGYVIIIVSGAYVERFVNICTRREILLWDMERQDSNTVRMKISIRGFKKARTAAIKSRCRVRIAAKKGLPYILSKYKKRKGFLIGILAFALLIYLMTSMIWTIDIYGNKEVSAKDIIDQINELGIYRGVAKRFIDPKRVADTLMVKNEALSWVGVEIKGTKLSISVQEGIKPPVLIPIHQPCHIVAGKDGFILSMHIKNGLATVKEGDTVMKGQILISGNVESVHPEFGVKQVHAMGEVIARTWYETKKEIPKKRMVRRRTGEEWNKYSIYFLDFSFPLPSGKNPFALFETGIFDKAPVIANRFRLPLGMTVQRFFEIQEEEQSLKPEEARELAQKSAVRELNRLIPPKAEIVDQQIQIIGGEGKEFILITIECTEDIAVGQEIGGD